MAPSIAGSYSFKTALAFTFAKNANAFGVGPTLSLAAAPYLLVATPEKKRRELPSNFARLAPFLMSSVRLFSSEILFVFYVRLSGNPHITAVAWLPHE